MNVLSHVTDVETYVHICVDSLDARARCWECGQTCVVFGAQARPTWSAPPPLRWRMAMRKHPWQSALVETKTSTSTSIAQADVQRHGKNNHSWKRSRQRQRGLRMPTRTIIGAMRFLEVNTSTSTRIARADAQTHREHAISGNEHVDVNEDVTSLGGGPPGVEARPLNFWCICW